MSKLEETKEDPKSTSKSNLSKIPGNKDGCKVLILGGCGFIGRHMVKYLYDKGKCKMIYCADKLIPQTSYMTKEQIEMFKDKNKVQLIQSDLSRDVHIDKVFKDKDFDYIINLCGETRFGQTDKDYQLKIIDTATKCVKAAENVKSLKKWIEISTSQVYKPEKSPVNEKGTLEPFTKLAQHRLKVENLLSKSKLPGIILRPSIVYGPGDKTGLTPRFICALCYKNSKQAMNFLWTPNLAINTIHVRDLCNAIWCCCINGKAGSLYNINDDGNTTQGSLNEIIKKVFNIKCGFKSAVLNKAAKAMMKQAAQASNDMHVPMWSDVCKLYKLLNTPLSPYIDQEILTKNYLCIDAKKITKELPFKLEHPKITCELVTEILDEYASQGYIPALKDMK